MTDDAAIAAAFARYARQYLPPPVPGEEQPPPDVRLAGAYANLAAYYQLRALTAAIDDPYSPVASAMRSNTGMIEHTAGGIGQLICEVQDVRYAVKELDRTVDILRASPIRRWTEKVDAWWTRFKLKRMPPPPPPVPDVPHVAVGAPPVPRPSIKVLDTYTGDQFEEYIAELLRRAGWSSVEVVGANARTPVGVGDDGVDIVAVDGDTRLAVQCKRLDPKSCIGAPAMRDFVGGAHAMVNATAMAFVTTTESFTPNARATAEKAEVLVIGRQALTDGPSGARYRQVSSRRPARLTTSPTRLTVNCGLPCRLRRKLRSYLSPCYSG